MIEWKWKASNDEKEETDMFEIEGDTKRRRNM